MTEPTKRQGVRITIKRKKQGGAMVPKSYPSDNDIKNRVEVSPTGGAAVIDSKPGPVTFTDKLKAYYHTIITVVGAILVLLNECLPITGMIPAYGTQAAGWVSAAIVFLTALVNALKSNETWVNAL